MATYGSYEGVRGILRRSLTFSTQEGKGGVTDEECAPHLNRAEAVVRSRLSRYYRFPLNSLGTDANSNAVWPYPVAEIVNLLAASYLTLDKFGEQEPNASDKTKELEQKAETLLGQVISGEITFQGNRRFAENHFTSGEIEPVRTSQKVRTEAPNPGIS